MKTVTYDESKWHLTPIDATRKMIDAAKAVEEDGYDAMHKAMLKNSPSPPLPLYPVPQ
ncbi:hypothetical protein [Eoetvoesiella caeni]|uniref:hypothetical protein n=1 Tax=Eoetvoesiella caeni TaxID=645616 RepID=UPI0014765DA3|nr:hypothetical protein [Eoetvoesiella caeni]MCI2811309.1 hypothetical protein [Eoetvoesiella caeni]NYT57192.1 hypothetical protein [Eoetvoesiella caeni]